MATTTPNRMAIRPAAPNNPPIVQAAVWIEGLVHNVKFAEPGRSQDP